MGAGNPRCVTGVVGCLALFLGSAAAQDDPRTIKDLCYSEADDAAPEHHLDLYLPGAGKPPLVMFIHGGTWRVGDRHGFALVGEALVRRGIACAVIDFRQGPDHGHPVLVEDCARAFAWLDAKAADYGYDRDQMFVMGHSSGAHLASLMSLDKRYLEAEGLALGRVRGVVAVSGVYDVSLNIPVFMEVFGRDHEVRRQASPLRLVRRDAPPFLLLWAADEMLGLDWSAENMRSHLKKHDARVEFAELADRNHATIITTLGQKNDITTPHIERFLERVVRGWPLAAATERK